ncbi:MAG TPA: hypothetical protein IGS40_01365 [Trichormus sp. M33_DOE_039]|nr:hypothetical protein [Trichormus sp. M33_DOE_039]
MAHLVYSIILLTAIRQNPYSDTNLKARQYQAFQTTKCELALRVIA